MNSHIATLVLLSGLATPCFAFAQPDDTMPVTDVTLYRSGVGSFQRQGTVTGNEMVDLAFKADQINDILKSLVVLDFDGGRVGAVGYSSDEPIGRRLEALGLNDTTKLSLGDLLGQFLGASVTMTTTNGDLTGRILGVETYTVMDQSDSRRNIRRFSLATSDGLTTVDEPDVRNVRLLDEVLQADLMDLLMALGSQRTEQTRTIQIDLKGQGDRRVMAAYVQETPIWKTSYRLVLPESEGDDLHIEGWAIVENTTDQDWEEISLTLVAGQPVGFQMDLATPLYLQRPTLAVPVELAAAPKMYARGEDFYDFAEAEDELALPSMSRGLRAEGDAQNSLGLAPDASGRSRSMYSRITNENMAKSTISMASGGDEGEVFFYRLDNPVTVEKRQSAMLPIITGAIEGRRVSVFSPTTQGNHPYRGVELTNSTNLKLMPGPLSVYDGSVFAGDSQIGYIGADEQRMLAYAVDLDVDAERSTNQNTIVQKIRIVDGVIYKTDAIESTHAVKLINHDSSAGRTVVVELPRNKDWTLSSEIQPFETTESLYRFEVELEPNQGDSVEATQARIQNTTLALTSTNLRTLLSYQRQGAASQAVIDAYKGYASRRADVDSVQEMISNNESETKRIAADQMRIRDLMRAITRQDALYARYMGQLETHEDALDGLRVELSNLLTEQEQKKQSLDLYVRTLRVE
jgi:hypothetical protein